MNSLIQLVDQHLSDDTSEQSASRARFRCTLKHMHERKLGGKARFDKLELPALGNTPSVR